MIKFIEGVYRDEILNKDLDYVNRIYYDFIINMIDLRQFRYISKLSDDLIQCTIDGSPSIIKVQTSKDYDIKNLRRIVKTEFNDNFYILLMLKRGKCELIRL